MTYLHDLPDWPNFTWRNEDLSNPVGEVLHKKGLLLGLLSSQGLKTRAEAVVETLTLEVVKSSAIEGEKVIAADVRSCLARHIGVDIGEFKPSSRAVDGLVEMMLDATRRFAEPLTKERLCGWHSALFPSGRSGGFAIKVGDYRDPSSGPMRVVSGSYGHEIIHYEAPAAERLPVEMEKFLAWFNQEPVDPLGFHPVLKAGLAHLWFIMIHPFEDGNGRIGRAITELALARAEGSPDRFYSMSPQIERERKAYYAILEKSQGDDLDITSWLEWFLSRLVRSIDGAENNLAAVTRRARVWRHANQHLLNDRQRLVLARLLDDFIGKLTTGKYAKLAKCSSDTAQRDLKGLMAYGLIACGEGGGRSVSYSLTDF